MRTLYLLIPINIGLLLTSCSALHDVHPVDTMPNKTLTAEIPNQSAPPPAAKTTTPAPVKKNPLAVSFYTKDNAQLTTPYKILGRESVSKYNLVGIKRQEASIRDSMRKIAASMGGDAIIEENRNSRIVTGTVVSFEDKEKNNNSV